MRALIASCWLALLLASGLAQAAPIFPALTGRLVDNAHLVDPASARQLEQMLAAHEQSTGEQVVVVTLPGLQGLPIEDYGYQLGRHWGIGQKGKDNGALLIVVPSERRLRIEVGYGLEDRLTDAQASVIINSVITPSFRREAYSDGIVAGVSAMLHVLGGEPLQESPEPEGTRGSAMFALLVMLVFVVMIMSGGGRGRGGRGGGLGAVLGGALGGGLGGFGGGGGGGGGFGGGGGSFGGGGSSGGW